MEKSDEQALARDWEAVGRYLRQAIEEAAGEVGNDAIHHVIEHMGEDVLPDASVIIYLEKYQPGIADWIIQRMAEIQHESHQAEWAEANNFRRKIRTAGRGMLRAV